MARIKLRAILNMKVSATPTALELIEDLKKTHGKDLLFHQSGGCCDGSAPMCYPANEYMVGDKDVLVGEIGGIPFYISKTQHEAWKNTDLIIDYTYNVQAEQTGITNLLQDIKDAGLKLKDLKTEQSTLEKIFVSLVKENNEI
ncbi:DUF779 domain-containing protein [Candidatus Pelagibacter sp.]|nr:DUF779 domain-containing protein [Candidatus Pelagibacter sp.]